MPSLTRAIFLSITAACAFIMASDFAPKFPLWFKFILVAIGIITAAGAIVEGINWVSYVASQRVAEIRHLSTITPVIEVVRLMTKMSPQAQVEIAMHFNLLGIDYRAWIGENGPQFVFQTGGYNIPYDFIENFFSLSSDSYLPPVRQWSDGSIEHKWADALTAFIVQRHFAIPAKGNKPAAWLYENKGTVSLKGRAKKCFFGSDETPLSFDEDEPGTNRGASGNQTK